MNRLTERGVSLNVAVGAVAIAMTFIVAFAGSMPQMVFADDSIGIADESKRAWTQGDGEHVKAKDLYATERVAFTLPVEDPDGNALDGINFQIWNATTQTNEAEVTSANGQISLSLINGHNYIFFPMDTKWQGKTYVWVRDGKLVSTKSLDYDTKTWSYPAVDSIKLTARSTELTNVSDARRHTFRWNLMSKLTDIAIYPKSVKFVSPLETVEGKTYTYSSGSTTVTANLLEDVDYMIVYDGGNTAFTVAALPVTYKDKSEYPDSVRDIWPLDSTYDHRCCQAVRYFNLITPSEAANSLNTIQTADGKTSIRGMDFIDENSGRYPYVHCKDVSGSYASLGLKGYQAFSILAENTARSETMKMAGIDFEITQVIDDGKNVKAVYEVKDGQLEEVKSFNQSGNSVTFTTDTLSIYPVVFEYSDTVAKPQTVSIRAIDQSGIAVSGITPKFVGNSDTYTANATNTYGESTFNCSQMAAGTYKVEISSTDGSTLISADDLVIVAEGGSNYVSSPSGALTITVAVPVNNKVLNVKAVDYKGNAVQSASFKLVPSASNKQHKTTQYFASKTAMTGLTSFNVTSILPDGGVESWTLTTTKVEDGEAESSAPIRNELTIQIDMNGIVDYQSTYTVEMKSSAMLTLNMNGHGVNRYSRVYIYDKIAKPTDPSATGYTFGGWYKEAACTNDWNFDVDTVQGDTVLYAKWTKAGDTTPTPDSQTKTIKMYRFYNQWSGEHFFTGSDVEKATLEKQGWTYESIGWYAPEKSNTPVYRMYNSYAEGGDHHYTTSAKERDMLVAAGWTDEGIAWYSDDAKGVAIYCQYNPYEFAHNHNYTSSVKEKDWLVGQGWNDEDIKWYGVKA